MTAFYNLKTLEEEKNLKNLFWEYEFTIWVELLK